MKRVSTAASEKDSLTPADYEALAAFRLGVRRYLAFAEAGAKSVGLTSQQHQALLAIKAHTQSRPMSIGDLAAQLLLRHHSVVELVSRMEKAGLTRREPDDTDRRKVLVSITDKGERVLAELSASNLKELRLVAPAFSRLLTRVDKLDKD